jgi:hypothetical protein
MGVTDPITAAVDGEVYVAGSSAASTASAQLPPLLEQAVVLEYVCDTGENFVTNLLVNASILTQKQRTSEKSSSTPKSINKHGLTSDQQKLLFSEIAKKDPDMAKKLDKNKVLNLVSEVGGADPPVGSVLARVITQASSGNYVILFPLFSHITIPSSAGETVFFIRDRLGGGDGTVGYWITRRPTHTAADNLNFTAQQSVGNVKGGRVINAGTSNEDPYNEVPNFDDGSSDNVNATSLVSDDPSSDTKAAKSVKSYEQIMDNSRTTAFTVNEATEKLSQRPNDLTIQGSNNTHIFLGMDRKDGLDLTDSCKDGGAGCVDIVAGKKIFSNTIENTRKFKEVDNRLGKRVQAAGDISLKDDKCRVRIVAKSSADKDFDIKFPTKTPSLDPKKPQIAPVDMKPYVVFKSDEIRIIARENGSIKIVKEGTKPGVTGGTYSAIIMHPDGTIQIDAEKIVMGRNDSEANGYVKYSEYNKQMTQLINYLNTTFTGISTGLKTTATPGYTGPDPGNIAAAQAIGQMPIITLSDARSNNVFGE